MSRYARALTVGLALSLLVGTQIPLQARSARSQERQDARSAPRPLPVAGDALHRAFRSGRLTEAQYVLKRVESLFRYKRVKREFGDVARPDPHAATLLLRDLALRVDDLSGEDAETARSIFLRPDDPQGDFFGAPYQPGPHETVCGAGYCLHWAKQNDPNAPDQTDADINGLPDFVDDTLATMDEVVAALQGLGYRSPKSDANSSNSGPDAQPDIYLADIGSEGVYGYCTTDDPTFRFRLDVSAYCVLDNDYAEQGFQTRTPLENLQVTAAHEFFHAVQFAYDWLEDTWLMEGTAASMEDAIYDDIDDNRQFLLASQITDASCTPVYAKCPLDWSPWDPNIHPGFGVQYGAWLWWRFMTEYLSSNPDAPDETVIRKIWERADAAPGGPDDYALKATKRVAKAYGAGFKKLFSRWGVFLYQPERFDEGLEYAAFLQSFGQEGHAPLRRSFTLSGAGPTSGWREERLDHLTSAFYRFRPGPNVTGADRLKIKVDGPKRWKGTSATLLSISGDSTTIKRFRFSKKGVGTVKVAFPDEAILILQNASTRVRNCYNAGTLTSCMGVPRDDNKLFKAKARLIEN